MAIIVRRIILVFIITYIGGQYNLVLTDSSWGIWTVTHWIVLSAEGTKYLLSAQKAGSRFA